jgi:TonB family protein
MDCGRVAREEILEAYLLGRLTEEDREAFERHYFECAHCFDDLRSVQAIQEQLRQGGIEVQKRQNPLFVRWSLAAGLAAAAVPVVLVLWMRSAVPSFPPEAAKASQVQLSQTRGAAIPVGDLAKGGGAGGVQLDVKNFCCPEYLAQVVQKIRQNWNARQGAGGQPTIKFTIRRDGMLTDVQLEKPSGQDPVDLEAQRAVISTQQLPPLPREFNESSLTVHFTFGSPSPSLQQLARVEPPRYEPVKFRNVPDDATRSFQRGMERYRRADFAGAVEDLRDAAALDPAAPHVRFFLGISHLMLGQDDAAIERLRATIALGDSPYLEEAHLYLAKAYLRRNDVRAAESQLKTLIDLHGSESAQARSLLTELERSK